MSIQIESCAEDATLGKAHPTPSRMIKGVAGIIILSL
jgi:hypothetical protein